MIGCTSFCGLPTSNRKHYFSRNFHEILETINPYPANVENMASS
jgi:hypothetical protein